jgi:long-chain fatty acid transport protein
MACASAASATTGYFALGYGAKSMGMVGAVVSNPQDTISAAANPASIGVVPEGWDVGMRFFSPIREAEINTSAPPLSAPYDVGDKSRRNLFLIPSLGITKSLNDKITVGFALYGNGGLNSTYDDNIYDQTAGAFGGAPQGVGTGGLTPDTGKLGVDLAQSLQALSIAYKANEAHTFGASLLVGVQRFSARGLGNFQCFTSAAIDPANQNLDNPLTPVVDPGPACAPGAAQAATPGFVPSPYLSGNNSDWAYGAGVRVGWIGDVTPNLTLGVAAASKVYMTEFDDYKELFAEQGDLDIPANFALSATFKATPRVKVSFDYQRILYEGVNSISNPGPIATASGPFPPAGIPDGLLGMDNGLGFGWEDVDIYRLAVEYARDSAWTYRAGVAYNTQPIDQSQVLFNILAPAVIQKHATVGFTFMPNKTSEWNFAYMHAFEEKVSTPLSAFGLPASIEMYQNSIDLSYSKHF